LFICGEREIRRGFTPAEGLGGRTGGPPGRGLQINNLFGLKTRLWRFDSRGTIATKEITEAQFFIRKVYSVGVMPCDAASQGGDYSGKNHGIGSVAYNEDADSK